MSRVDEALQRWSQWVKTRECCDYSIAPYMENVLTQSSDVELLADEYVKLRDLTPITEEWAAKVRSERAWLRRCELTDGTVFWSLRVRVYMDNEPSSTEIRVTTCGQVRGLYLVAGIECDA
jgi:hypothetical protein